MSRFEIRLSAAQSIVTDAENRWLSAGGATQEIVLHLMQTLVAGGGFDYFDDTPSAVGSASPGASLEVARGDHAHAHGNQGGGSLHAVATTGSNGFMSAADKLKLDEIETGATQNASDLHLTNRANHYGTQAISTVSGLQTALDDLAADIAGAGSGTVTSVGVTSWNPLFTVTGSPVTSSGTINFDLTSQPAGLVMASAPTGSGSGTPYMRALVASDIPALGYIATAEKGAASGVAPLGADSKVPALYLPPGFAPSSTDDLPEGATNLYFTTARAESAASSVAASAVATHVTALDPHSQYRKESDPVDWSELSSVPLTMDPSVHDHEISDVTGLQSALDGKLATGGEAATVATIAGRVTAGTNVTITGAGTAASPYQIAAAGGGGSPAGLNTQVQFNDGGVLGADADLTYNKTTNTLAVPAVATETITGPDSVTGVGIAVGAGTDARSLSVTPGEDAPNFVAGMSVFDMLHTGNTKTVAGQSINGYGDVQLSDGDVPATVGTITGTTKTLALTDRGIYQRWTATGAKTLTVNTSVGANAGEYHIRNCATSGDLTIVASGVTINAPKGGTLVLEPGDAGTLKQGAANVLDFLGSTKAA